MRWVETTLRAYACVDQVTNQSAIHAIFARIGNPSGGGGDMPRLNGSDSRVTPTQYAHLQRWQSSGYVADWTGVSVAESTVSADGLDRAALEACVGTGFYSASRPEV